jgi:acyl carrier protein
MEARELLRQVGAGEDLCAALRDDDDLLAAGVGSAEMIELGLLVEETLERELSAEEVERLSTLGDVETLLARGF